MKKRVLAILLCVMMVMALLPTVAFAAPDEQTLLDISKGSITIGENFVSGKDSVGNDVTESNLNGYIIIGETTNYIVTVTGGIHNITFNNVSIDVTGTSGACAFAISADAEVNLTLEGANALKSGEGKAGLGVPKGATLTVTGESSGSLSATGGNGGAGIGGKDGPGDYNSCGMVTVNSGTVIAAGGFGGAGIGGGASIGYTPGIGGNNGDPIGGDGGTVNISGGTVTATGGDGGAGIGGGSATGVSGYGGGGSTVNISGGIVSATGGDGGAGIGGGGGGSNGDPIGGDGGTVNIRGGTVTATGINGNKGIGGGMSANGDGGDGSTVSISGGTVTAAGGFGGGTGKAYGTDGSAGTLTNGIGADVFLVTLTLDGAAANTPIESLAAGGYNYGMSDVKTIDDKLYLYLPQGTTVSGVVTGEDTPRTFANSSSTAITVKNNNSNAGTLAEPSVTVNPESANVYVGDEVTLTATAINIQNPVYVWSKVIVESNTPVSGATESTYTPPTDDVGTIAYYCLVSSSDHSEIFAFSKLIEVTVSPLPTYAVTLPSGTGYTAAADGTSTNPTAKGGNYSFTLTIDSNYEKGTDFAVKANGTALTSSGDVYTISNITSTQTVTVEGVVMKDADYTAVDTAIGKIPADLSQYTEESANAVTIAKNAVVRGKKINEQSTVDSYATAIEDAVMALEYKDADYSTVDEAIAKIPSDLSDYTEETAKAVTDAKNAVDRSKDITEQATVDGYATAINNAVAALEYKGADYRKVDEAIAKIPSDLSNYTDETVRALNTAKNAVERGKNITEQATVDGYATAIENALDALEYKGADYSAVDEAINKIPTDISSYTDETVKAVNDAKDAVVRGKDITEQEAVDGYADAINNAISALERKKLEPEPPQTGDNSNMALWLALLFVSGSTAAVLGISQKRKKAK